jgi:hypothetical protein
MYVSCMSCKCGGERAAAALRQQRLSRELKGQLELLYSCTCRYTGRNIWGKTYSVTGLETIALVARA